MSTQWQLSERRVWDISVQHKQHSNPKKVYLVLAEGKFKKQRYYNHTQSFQNENYSNSTTLSSYVWKMWKTKNETPLLLWEIIRTAPLYKHNKAIFFMSPWELSHIYVSKLEWTLKQEVRATFKESAWKQIFIANI